MSQKHFLSRGYSLVEVAIALGVIGFVTSVIWAYASTNDEIIKRQLAIQEVQTVVANTRAFYSGQIGVATSGYPSLTFTLITNNAIPTYMPRPGGCHFHAVAHLCADNPWGSADPSDYPMAPTTPDPNGTFRVCDWTVGAGQTSCNPVCQSPPAVSCPGTSQDFAIAIRNIPIGACIQLATVLSGPAGPAGLSEININGCNILEGTGCSPYTPTPSFPVTTTDATALCTAAENANILSLVYNLRLPEN